MWWELESHWVGEAAPRQTSRLHLRSPPLRSTPPLLPCKAIPFFTFLHNFALNLLQPPTLSLFKYPFLRLRFDQERNHIQTLQRNIVESGGC
jgi:hypothetical protein